MEILLYMKLLLRLVKSGGKIVKKTGKIIDDLWTGGHNKRCETGALTKRGRKFTEHGAEQANNRGYTPDMVDDIIDDWTDKVYQPGGKTVYIQRRNDGYHVVILDSLNNIVSVIGGAKGGNTLQNWASVERMLNNNGGYTRNPFQ